MEHRDIESQDNNNNNVTEQKREIYLFSSREEKYDQKKRGDLRVTVLVKATSCRNWHFVRFGAPHSS